MAAGTRWPARTARRSGMPGADAGLAEPFSQLAAADGASGLAAIAAAVHDARAGDASPTHYGATSAHTRIPASSPLPLRHRPLPC